jgi:hypothetical protein
MSPAVFHSIPRNKSFGLGDRGLEVPVDCLAGTATDTVFSSWAMRLGGRIDTGIPSGPCIAGVVMGDGNLPLERAARDLYRNLLEQANGAFLYRIWNYVPAIHEAAGGMDNYRRFCLGRSVAMEEEYGPAFCERAPAASAVGGKDGVLMAVYLAGSLAPRHMENSRQIPAYRYPRRYGPRPPSFARATAVKSGGMADFFVAGTSAILGHETMAPGRTADQLEHTLDNLGGISRTCGLGGNLGAGRAKARHFKVYLRHPGDLAAVSSALNARLLIETDQVSYIRADICREELNLEIEATILGVRAP